MELERTSSKSAVATSPSWTSLFAAHDVFLLGYLAVVGVLVRRGGGNVGSAAMRHVVVTAVVVLFGILFARGLGDVSPRVRAVVYRLCLSFAVIENYLMLRDVLPVVRPDAVDAALYNIDLRLFGVEPAVWMQRWNTLPVVEYFAFFYYSYFFICLTYLLLAVFFTRANRYTTEYAVGVVIVYCVGQIGYMAVPAYGPVQALAHEFTSPVQGGLFWGLVKSAVAAGGAMKDVFPSLHTAAPVFFALHAFSRARADRRFLPLAYVTAFFACNIIFSTMFLRWHYAIDVVAGLVLAFSAAAVSRRVATWEDERRRRAGLDGIWTFA